VVRRGVAQTWECPSGSHTGTSRHQAAPIGTYTRTVATTNPNVERRPDAGTEPVRCCPVFARPACAAPSFPWDHVEADAQAVHLVRGPAPRPRPRAM